MHSTLARMHACNHTINQLSMQNKLHTSVCKQINLLYYTTLHYTYTIDYNYNYNKHKHYVIGIREKQHTITPWNGIPWPQLLLQKQSNARDAGSDLIPRSELDDQRRASERANYPQSDPQSDLQRDLQIDPHHVSCNSNCMRLYIADWNSSILSNLSNSV